jgi:hypothetical protein
MRSPLHAAAMRWRRALAYGGLIGGTLTAQGCGSGTSAAGDGGGDAHDRAESGGRADAAQTGDSMVPPDGPRDGARDSPPGDSANPEAGGAGCPYAASAAKLGIDDGCTKAPVGPAAYAGLLAAHGKSRPPWDVAGVEFQVGVPAGAALKDPTAGTLPACASYDASSHVVTVSASHCTLSAYDFTKGGGLQLSIPSGVSDTTVKSCLFGLTGNPGFSTALLDRRGGSLTVESSTFQGTGQDPMYFDTGASGTVIFRYDSFYDTDGDGMDFGSSQTVIVEYDACVKIGMKAGTHPDCVQFCGGVLGPLSHESFNLSYQPVGVVVGGAQGIQVSEQCGGTIDGYSADHNTVIAPDAANLTMSYSVYNNGQDVSLVDNYIDSTGSYGPFYPTGTATCTGNVALTNAHGFTPGASIAGTFGSMTCK